MSEEAVPDFQNVFVQGGIQFSQLPKGSEIVRVFFEVDQPCAVKKKREKEYRADREGEYADQLEGFHGSICP